ncbi:hypothetical protein [Metabacillus endolithicus]|uniref:hypothetical protein n=1 Tax=Metabacillus endolithicus TaxID=1535204 RepID=UPI001FF7A41A|nr:hypothetical protein [Metabacillus endolithicus]UPG63423.1 hypothetical protein MVE64_24660 [Metabacillus endolithicus]
MRSYLILIMCFLFLIQYFVQQTWLGYVVVTFVIASFFASVIEARGFPRIIGLIMMGTGIILEFYKGEIWN